MGDTSQRGLATICWGILSIAAVAPIAVAAYPPSTDYVQWLFQGYVLSLLLSGSSAASAIQPFYAVSHVPIPNTAAPLLLGLLDLLLPVQIAGRVVLAGCILALAWAFGFTVRSFQQQPTAVEFLGFPWAIGYFAYWGFLGYLLSLATAALGIALVHRMTLGKPETFRARDLALLTAWTVITYLCHLFGWLVLVVTVVAYAVVLRRGTPTRSWRPLLLTLVPSLFMLVLYIGAHHGVGRTSLYTTLVLKVVALASPFVLFLRTDPFDTRMPVAFINAIAGLLLFALLATQWRRHAVVRGTSPLLVVVGVLLAGTLFSPFSWFGGLVTPDSRLVLPIGMLVLAALPWRPLKVGAALATVSIVMLILLAHIVEYRAASERLAAVATATAAIPPAAHVLALDVHRPPVRGGCLEHPAWPSIGAPTLDWFALYRLLGTRSVGASIFDSSVLLPKAGSTATLDVFVEQVLPEAVPGAGILGPRFAQTFRYVEVFGCPDDRARTAAALSPQYVGDAHGDGFDLLVRSSAASPTPALGIPGLPSGVVARSRG